MLMVLQMVPLSCPPPPAAWHRAALQESVSVTLFVLVLGMHCLQMHRGPMLMQQAALFDASKVSKA